MKIQAVKGARDILPTWAGGEVDTEAFEFIERTCRGILQNFGFSEIKTPIFEYTDLFTRGIGTHTDIVEKEMYTFEDRDGKKISLRPEGTASVVRALVQHSLHATWPTLKLFYTGPMFRHERPQKGRYRQFFQVGAEILGPASATADVEILSLLHLLFEKLNIRDLTLLLNSLGCEQCRPAYRKKLKEFLKERLPQLCQNCQRRFETNPLRILDCKEDGCRQTTQGVPAMADHLCQSCSEHFGEVKNGLALLNIPFEINHRMVRGLDYYVKTAFELVSSSLGAQNAVAAGGRYDGLVETLGGPPMSGIGFAIGMERTIALLDKSALPKPPALFFVATLGQKARQWATEAVFQLRRKGIWAEMDYQGSSLKSQMKRADKLGANFALIIGEDEIQKGQVVLRNMHTKAQEELDLSQWLERCVQHLPPPDMA